MNELDDLATAARRVSRRQAAAPRGKIWGIIGGLTASLLLVGWLFWDQVGRRWWLEDKIDQYEQRERQIYRQQFDRESKGNYDESEEDSLEIREIDRRIGELKADEVSRW